MAHHAIYDNAVRDGENVLDDTYQSNVSLLPLLMPFVSTVDASQGGEADIVILSYVRGSSGKMGFLKENHRLNAALT